MHCACVVVQQKANTTTQRPVSGRTCFSSQIVGSRPGSSSTTYDDLRWGGRFRFLSWIIWSLLRDIFLNRCADNGVGYIISAVMDVSLISVMSLLGATSLVTLLILMVVGLTGLGVLLIGIGVGIILLGGIGDGVLGIRLSQTSALTSLKGGDPTLGEMSCFFRRVFMERNGVIKTVSRCVLSLLLRSWNDESKVRCNTQLYHFYTSTPPHSRWLEGHANPYEKEIKEDALDFHCWWDLYFLAPWCLG